MLQGISLDRSESEGNDTISFSSLVHKIYPNVHNDYSLIFRAIHLVQFICNLLGCLIRMRLEGPRRSRGMIRS
jgi:hypothetical protein